ncbi:DUF4158 domain-containing protein [Streptomyces sp. NPDC002426]
MSRRPAHIRLGFTAQRTTARHLGVLLDDPADVPPEAVDYLAEQLDMGDPSVLSKSGSDFDTSALAGPTRTRGEDNPGRRRRRRCTRAQDTWESACRTQERSASSNCSRRGLNCEDE